MTFLHRITNRKFLNTCPDLLKYIREGRKRFVLTLKKRIAEIRSGKITANKELYDLLLRRRM
jgi:hypothetical protein